MKKGKLTLIGLLQAVGIIVYCILIALLFNFLGKTITQPAGILGSALMLVIVVFSAGVTGSIVFGYPAYLFLKHKKSREALLILFFTAVFCLAILALAGIIYFVV